MGFFEKLLGKSKQAVGKALHATDQPVASAGSSSGTYRNDKAASWIMESGEVWQECHDSLRSVIKSSDPGAVRAAVIPCLTTNIETVKKVYQGILSGIFPFRHLPTKAAVGVTWCRACQHPTFLISNPRPGQRQTCSACGREWVVNFFEPSAAAMEQVRDIFERHSVCLDRMERGEDLFQRGKIGDALVMYREAEAICRGLDNRGVLAAVLDGIAFVLYDRGESAAALDLYDEIFRLHQAGGDRPGMAEALRGRGSALVKLAIPDLAGVYLDQAEDILREDLSDHGSMRKLRGVLVIKAVIASESVATISRAPGLLDEADRLDDSVRKHFREKTGQELPSESTDRLRQIIDKKRATLGDGFEPRIREINEAHARGNKARVFALTQRVIDTFREFGDLPNLRKWLNGALQMFFENGKILEGLKACEELENIARVMQDKPALQAALNNQAEILKLLDQAAQAQAKSNEAQALDKELRVVRGGLQARKDALAAALRAKDWNGAARLAAQQEEALRLVGQDEELMEVINNLIEAEQGRQDLEAAIRASERLEALGRRITNPPIASMGLEQQGVILLELGRSRDAVARLARAASSLDEAIAKWGGSEHAGGCLHSPAPPRQASSRSRRNPVYR